MSIRRVDAATMRERFNREAIWDRALEGKLRRVEVSRLPGGSRSGQPAGTETVMERIESFDGFLEALVHYFERPDGTTTLPDPKYLRHGDEIWKLGNH